MMGSNTPQLHENQPIARVGDHGSPQDTETTESTSWVKRQIAAMQFTDQHGNTWWDTKEVVFRAALVVPLVFSTMLLATGALSWVTASSGQDDDYQMVAEEIEQRLEKAAVVEGRFQQVYRDTLEEHLGVPATQIDEDLAQARTDLAQALSLSYRQGERNPLSAVEVELPEGMSGAGHVVGDWQDWHIDVEPGVPQRYTVLVEFIEFSDEDSELLDELLTKHRLIDLDPVSLGAEVLQDQEVRSLMKRQTGQRWVLAAEFTTTLPGDVTWVRTTWMDGLPQVALHEDHRVVAEDDVPDETSEQDSIHEYTETTDNETTEG